MNYLKIYYEQQIYEPGLSSFSQLNEDQKDFIQNTSGFKYFLLKQHVKELIKYIKDTIFKRK